MVGALALVGLVTAVYLTLFQLKAVGSVWDPFSLGGSRWVLRRSPLVRWLGFPDASIGIVAYVADLALDVPGPADRAVHRPWQVLLLGAVAAAMAAGSLVLVALQAVYAHWCSLCLVSAAASVAIAALVAPEISRATHVVRERRKRGATLVAALRHHPGGPPDASSVHESTTSA